ncbi:MAG: alcohol dehydrogenase catalytic domain-containing protein [Acidobacteria bacterium]|nr:alcohol dehydrogenase catalytic domain-containing protein [Acidobacteriota bacterium]
MFPIAGFVPDIFQPVTPSPTVRPLDACGNCPACRRGHRHICQKLKFLGIDTPGALQGLWNVPAHRLHRIPDNLSFEHAALIEPRLVTRVLPLDSLEAGFRDMERGGDAMKVLVACGE